MKKILVSIVAMVFAIPTFAQFSSGGFDLDKENLYYGVRIGLIGGNFSGHKDVSGTKMGLGLGGVIGLRISPTTPLFLESGLYYTERGAKDGKDKVGYNNLEVPLLIKYGIKAGDIAILPFLGPYFAQAISGKSTVDGVKYGTFDEDGWNAVKRFNMGLKLGCGLEFNNLYVEGGYQFGLNNISKIEEFTVHSNALFLNVGVNF